MDERPLRFTITTDDEFEHRRYLMGPRALGALWDFSEALRSKIKYSGEDGPKDGWQGVRELFLEHAGEILAESD